MGKRASNQSPKKSTNKRVKRDPVLASIADVIKKADDLPDRCRNMLVEMLPFSLGVTSDQRHETQTWAVGAVEQTINAQKSALEYAIAAEEAKLETLKSSEAGLVTAVQDAEAALDTQKSVVQGAEHSLTASTDTSNAASNALLAAQTEQQAVAEKLSGAQEDKAKLESASEAHFKAPMEEGKGPHFKELQPFLKQIALDASFIKALPVSCAKAKEDRGSFDEVVLKELEKALVARLATLNDIVAVETPALGEREAAVQSAEKDHTTKTDVQKEASDALEAAKTAQSDRETTLATARQAVEGFQPQVDAITNQVEVAKAALADFETGPLAGFTSYRDRVEVSAEVATAGA